MMQRLNIKCVLASLGLVGLVVTGMAKPCLPTFHSPNQFFAFVRPIVDQQNEKIIATRKHILALHDDWLKTKGLDKGQQRFLANIAQEYHVAAWSVSQPKAWKQLISRVDMIPESLALAQAANESAWGRSRFAVQACNIYGQWCYRKGCGLVPKRRPDHASYEVRRFESVSDSVAAYTKNLNTHRAYKHFRAKRAALRKDNQRLTANALLPTLKAYTLQNKQYTTIIGQLIHRYHLEHRNSS